MDGQGAAESFDELAQGGEFRVGRVFELGDARLGHPEPLGEFFLIDPQTAPQFGKLIGDDVLKCFIGEFGHPSSAHWIVKNRLN
jgi:hypothetical protein